MKMNRSKKGIFFTFMCFLLVVLVVIIFATSRNLNLQYKQPVVQDREQNVNELYKTLDEAVMIDVLRISSVQALLKTTADIKSNKQYLSTSLNQGNQFDDKIRADALNPYSLGSFLTNIQNFIKDSYNLDVVELSFQPVSITQNDPWLVEVSGKGTILLKDTANSLAWKSEKDYIVKIPIEGLPDPLWAGKGIDVDITNKFNFTLYGGVLQRNTTGSIIWEKLRSVTTAASIMNGEDDRINLLMAAINQTVFFHPTTEFNSAPNYLQRFAGGNERDAKTGIFAFANLELQKKITVANAHKSYVDFKFIKSSSQSNLEYVVGITDIDGKFTILQAGDPPRPITKEFHIDGIYNEKAVSDADSEKKFRFKLDSNDRDYFKITLLNYHCLDDVDERYITPNFGSLKPICYSHATNIGPPKASFTG